LSAAPSGRRTSAALSAAPSGRRTSAASSAAGKSADSPRFFATPAAFRRWLHANLARATELWVVFHKRATGKPSLTWPQSVDEALCVGWIDAVRKSLGPESYVIRFTRRKERSNWSAVNVRRMKALRAEGRVLPAGEAAFAAATPERTAIYSYEQRKQATLDSASEAQFWRQPAAWADFQSRPPWYRRTATHWVTSAKKEETRARLLAQLIEASEAGRPIRQLERPTAKTTAVRGAHPAAAPKRR